MQSFLSLIMGLEYIEANLTNPISLEDIASSAYISLSHLHRMFTHVFGCSLKEYMTKRSCVVPPILTSPSAFRRRNRFSELYPKIVLEPNTLKGENQMTATPKYDLSELSKRILAAKGTYILDVDIDQLERINDALGRGAGDVAIAETAARIAKNVPPDTAFFRIGADEFIVITERGKLQAAEDIAERILSHSDDPVAWNDTTFTFSVSIGIAKIPTDIHELSPALELVQEAMYRAKKKDGNPYKVL